MKGLPRRKYSSDPEKLSILQKEEAHRSSMSNWGRQMTPTMSIRSSTTRSSPIPTRSSNRQHAGATSETVFLHDGIYGDSPVQEYIGPGVISTSYQSSIVSNDYIAGQVHGHAPVWATGERPRSKALSYNGQHYGSSQSVVCVDICDLNGDEEMLATTQCLHSCKELVLKPYKRLLLMIGWRPFRKDKETNSVLKWRIVNFFYPIVIIAFMLFYDILQGITCQGKLNIIEDTLPHPTKSPPTEHPPSVLYVTHTTNLSKNNMNRNESPMCSHLIPTYVLPSLLHMAAFIYGFYHFRVHENEQLYSLMERVFIRTRNSIGSHLGIIRNSGRYRYGAYVWITLHIILEILYNFAYGEETFVLSRSLGYDNCGFLIFLLTLKFIGLILVHTVNIAVILNYCTQCEMLITYIKDINLWLREKSMDLKQVMHEILKVREFISVLNGTLGKMTALCVVNFIEMSIIGLCLLFLNKDDDALVWCYRTLYIAIWLIAFLVPLVQGARLSKTAQRLRQVSFEMRVFGYQHSSQLDLDSFILFVNSATLRAKLLGIAIRPALLIIFFGGFLFILILLLIAEILSIGPYRNLF